MKKIATSFLLSLCFCTTLHANAHDLLRLQRAYPHQIIAVSNQTITWTDGSVMSAGIFHHSIRAKLEHPSLIDQIKNVYYTRGRLSTPPVTDPGRVRYEPFFQKMYGASKVDVQKHLVSIFWMPHYFGTQSPLLVTTVNDVHLKLAAVSQALERLVAQHPEYLPYLEHPGGTFKWRKIANTTRQSNHSFGMTFDLQARMTDYWQWDLKKAKRPITEDQPLRYRNTIPFAIVNIFEHYGFIWGGKWKHYDTMHFEYRPELCS